MDRKLYERTTEKELVGRKVRSCVPLSNSMYKIPAGTIFTIERKRVGLALISDPCPHCGVRVSITHVPPGNVDFVETSV